ncbi:MAG TPA: hypothetical protein VN903_27020, partial [Polyangia bacterium]|nr:hypothetical protein [Polyangia bacterium]
MKTVLTWLFLMLMPPRLYAVTHPTAVRQTIGDTVLALINGGTPPGKLVMQTAGAVTVATLTFSNTAFGATNGSGVATANAITSD